MAETRPKLDFGLVLLLWCLRANKESREGLVLIICERDDVEKAGFDRAGATEIVFGGLNEKVANIISRKAEPRIWGGESNAFDGLAGFVCNVQAEMLTLGAHTARITNKTTRNAKNRLGVPHSVWL